LVTPSKEGIVVTVKNISRNNKVGPLDIEKGEVFFKTNILEKFKDGYEIEPGVEYDEITPLVVPKDSIYSISAELNYDSRYEVDNTTIIQAK
jgi:hypothetical protein